MKKVFSILLSLLIVSSLCIPVFATDSEVISSDQSGVRYGLYDDHFIFEGVSYSFSFFETTLLPSFMYLDNNTLYIGFRDPAASPYVTIAADGKLTYYDSLNCTRLVYSVSSLLTLSYQGSITSRRIDSSSNDIDSFRSAFLVSVYNIFYAPDFNGGGIFRSAQPVVMYEDVPPSVGAATDHDFYSVMLIFFVAVILLLAVLVFVR